MSELRLRLTEHVLEARPLTQGTESTGELATLAVQGVDGLELVFARYFPQMMLADRRPDRGDRLDHPDRLDIGRDPRSSRSQ